MSGMDGTGPLGMGSQTGRGFGRCSGRQDFQRQGRQMNCRRGMGFGRGVRLNDNFSNQTDEKSLIEEEKRILEDRLERITQRLND